MNNRMDEYGGVGMGPGRGGISLRNLRTFRSFKNPVYRLYYGGLMGQMAAMNMQMIAGLLLIYRLTGSAAILGGMALANAIPMLSLSLFGGVIADRVQKKHVMLVGQTGSLVVSLGIALALTLGYLSAERTFTILGIVIPSWWILVVTAVLQGIIVALMMPSRQAIIPEIVGEEELMNAISLNTMGMNSLRIFAPVIAGFLIDAFDFAAVYYVMTGMYLTSVAFIAFLPFTSTITVSGGGALAHVIQGFKYLRNEITLLLIMVFTLLAFVLSMPYGLLLPIFTEDILKVGAAGMGVLMSASGLGAIAGSIVLASLPNKKRGLMLLVSTLFLSLILVAFAFSASWPLSLTLIVFLGLGQTGLMTLSFTLIQYYVEEEYRGRVMSILMMQFGLMSFGTFAAGVLAESIGVQWAVGGFALVLVSLSILALAFVPRIRKLD